MPHTLPNLDARVARGRQVRLRFAIFDGSDDLIDSGDLTCRHGEGALFPAVEAALVGLAVGDIAEMNLSPARAFGPRDDHLVLRVPAVENHQIGSSVHATTPDGQLATFRVVAINRGVATLDGNHPLAGCHLRVVVRVMEIQQNRPVRPSNTHASRTHRRRRPKRPPVHP